MPPKKAKKKMGRPPAMDAKMIKMVERMAKHGCTLEEIGDVLGVSRETVRKKAHDEYRRGFADMKTSLRKRMWNKAKEGHPAMMIFLAKNFLGMRDNPEVMPESDPAPQLRKVVLVGGQTIWIEAGTNVDLSAFSVGGDTDAETKH